MGVTRGVIIQNWYFKSCERKCSKAKLCIFSAWLSGCYSYVLITYQMKANFHFFPSNFADEIEYWHRIWMISAKIIEKTLVWLQSWNKKKIFFVLNNKQNKCLFKTPKKSHIFTLFCHFFVVLTVFTNHVWLRLKLFLW